MEAPREDWDPSAEGATHTFLYFPAVGERNAVEKEEAKYTKYHIQQQFRV